jgi:hypothetical protein
MSGAGECSISGMLGHMSGSAVSSVVVAVGDEIRI